MQLNPGYKSQLAILFFGMVLVFKGQVSTAQEFVNVTDEAGLNLVLLAGTGTNSVTVADFDGDGILDVYFVQPSAFDPANKGTWNRIYKGNGEGTFTEITNDIGIFGKGEEIATSYMGKKMGASWGDFNNDGYPDLFLTHAGPDQLLLNNGDGTFTDITQTTGVAGGETQFSSTALWFDYDSDGDLDLYVSIWEDYAEEDRDLKNRMYENLGDGTFKDVSEESGLNDRGKTWMAVAIDINNNGLLDLYLANDFGENKLYINHPNKTFTEEAESYGLNDRYEGMGLAIGDANNDGLFDFYLTNATEKPFNEEQINPLFINTGDGFFENKSVEAGIELAGWGWDTQFLDYNNDGWEDLFVVNGYFESSIDENRFFKNTSTQEIIAFEEISSSLAINDLAESRNFVAFDYNNDGAQDILISNFASKPVLYKNTTDTGNWLNVELEGTETNRNGFGTIVEVETGANTYRKYHHGAHFYGQSILPVHFGLGGTEKIERLTVYWLNGHADEFTNISVNQSLKIVEKEGMIISIEENINRSLDVPATFKLLGNYPNPFNGSTKITFELSKTSEIQLNIYNSIGQLIHSKTDLYSTGLNSISWNPGHFNSGVYFYRINDLNSTSKISKMLYLK